MEISGTYSPPDSDAPGDFYGPARARLDKLIALNDQVREDLIALRVIFTQHQERLQEASERANQHLWNIKERSYQSTVEAELIRRRF